jgi:hypothetical protein
MLAATGFLSIVTGTRRDVHGLRWVAAVGGATALMAVTSGLPVTAQITYVETSHGKTVGATATGVVGHGAGAGEGGSICLSGDVAFGKFKSGSSFPPTSGTYSTPGGTGLGATLRLSGNYRIAAVSGTTALQLTATGPVTIRPGSLKGLPPACRALAQLTR